MRCTAAVRATPRPWRPSVARPLSDFKLGMAAVSYAVWPGSVSPRATLRAAAGAAISCRAAAPPPVRRARSAESPPRLAPGRHRQQHEPASARRHEQHGVTLPVSSSKLNTMSSQPRPPLCDVCGERMQLLPGRVDAIPVKGVKGPPYFHCVKDDRFWYRDLRGNSRQIFGRNGFKALTAGARNADE
jgi:hypothetical protein